MQKPFENPHFLLPNPLFFRASPLLTQPLMQPHWAAIGVFKIVMGLVTRERKEWARYRYIQDDASKATMLAKLCMTAMKFPMDFIPYKK